MELIVAMLQIIGITVNFDTFQELDRTIPDLSQEQTNEVSKHNHFPYFSSKTKYGAINFEMS